MPELVTAARELLYDGLARSTRKSYATALNRYTEFVRRVDATRDPLPVTGEDATLFITFLYTQKVWHSTIKNYLSGLRSAHVDEDMSTDWRKSNRLQRTFRAIKRRQTGNASAAKLPVTFDVLRQMRTNFSEANFDELMMLTAAWVGTSGLLRTGEFTLDDDKPEEGRLLTVGQLAWLPTNPPIAALRLLASKTDPFRFGVTVHISNENAIELLQTYLAMRASNGPIAESEPLFADSNGQALKRKNLLRRVEAALNATGVDMTAHKGMSFRRGGATALSRAGIPEHAIQVAGRWKSLTVRRYIETDPVAIARSVATL